MSIFTALKIICALLTHPLSSFISLIFMTENGETVETCLDKISLGMLHYRKFKFYIKGRCGVNPLSQNYLGHRFT